MTDQSPRKAWGIGRIAILARLETITAELLDTGAKRDGRGRRLAVRRGGCYWSIRGRRSCGSPFPAFNAAAVNNQALVADRDSGHIQTLMDQPECMAGIQSLLHLRPDGKKLSHQLRRLLPSERFDCRQRVFI